MRKLILFALSFLFSTLVFCQNWETVGTAGAYFGNSLTSKDGLLYAATGTTVYKYDGTTLTTLSSFNNSLNTPNRTTNALKMVGGILYRGSKDFNTKGQGNIHKFDGTDWIEMTGTQKFSYSGNSKIWDFEEYNGELYTTGNFTVGTAIGIAKWDGSKWVNPGITTTEGIKLVNFKNKLYMVGADFVATYDGIVWDTLNLNESQYNTIKDAVILGDAIYFAGMFQYRTQKMPSNILKFDGENWTQVYDYSFSMETFQYNQEFEINKLHTGGSILYATAKETSTGNAWLLKYENGGWTKIAKLADANTGVVSGYEVVDYNTIQVVNNKVYIGGRFVKINGQEISYVAQLSDIISGNRDKVSVENITFWPNPAKGQLFIGLDGKEADARIEIISQLGEVLLSQALTDVVNIEGLAGGIYICRISGKNITTKTQQLVIE